VRTATPTPRLRGIPIGQSVILIDGTTRTLTVAAIRPDGYIELTQGGRLIVTASPCHLILESK
jgi:hypothetical protein